VSSVRRLPVEIQAEVQRLTAKIRDSEDDAVLRSLVSAREALEWAEGRANCTPTDFIVEPISEPIAGLTPQQLDGMACGRRGAAAVQVDGGDGDWTTITVPAMVPLAEAPSLFVCDPACKVPPLDITELGWRTKPQDMTDAEWAAFKARNGR